MSAAFTVNTYNRRLKGADREGDGGTWEIVAIAAQVDAGMRNWRSNVFQYQNILRLVIDDGHVRLIHSRPTLNRDAFIECERHLLALPARGHLPAHINPLRGASSCVNIFDDDRCSLFVGEHVIWTPVERNDCELVQTAISVRIQRVLAQRPVCVRRVWRREMFGISHVAACWACWNNNENVGRQLLVTANDGCD